VITVASKKRGKNRGRGKPKRRSHSQKEKGLLGGDAERGRVTVKNSERPQKSRISYKNAGLKGGGVAAERKRTNEGYFIVGKTRLGLEQTNNSEKGALGMYKSQTRGVTG